MTRQEPKDAYSEEGNEYNSFNLKELGKSVRLEDQKCWVHVPDSYDLQFQINILKLIKKYPDQRRNSRVVVGFNGNYYFYRPIQSDSHREGRVAEYWDNFDNYNCDDDSGFYNLFQRAQEQENYFFIVSPTVDSDEGSPMHDVDAHNEVFPVSLNEGTKIEMREDGIPSNITVLEHTTENGFENKCSPTKITGSAEVIETNTMHKNIEIPETQTAVSSMEIETGKYAADIGIEPNMNWEEVFDTGDDTMEKDDQVLNSDSEALGQMTVDEGKQSSTKLTNSKRKGDGILSTKSSKKQQIIKEQNSSEKSKSAKKAAKGNLGKKSTSKKKAKKADIETNKVASPSSSPKPQSRHFLDEDTPSSTESPLYKFPVRRSVRSSARKARQKILHELIELSSDEETDEESDDDIPTPQPTPNCDNDTAVVASLNQELNHSSRNKTGTKQEECEKYSERISPRTRSRDSKYFVECTRIAIGNQVYFEDMEMSFVPNKRNQYFVLCLDSETKLQIDVEDIEEAQYYMPCHYGSSTIGASGGESDESEVDTGNDIDLNELADRSDDEADLKKSLNAQKKRITIDDEEKEENEEQSLKAVSLDPDTSREVTSDMFEVDKDVEIQGGGINNQVIALDDNSTDDGGTLANGSNPDHVSKFKEPPEEAKDDIRSHYYLILRAKPSEENGLTTFTSNKHYYRSMPKSTSTKSTQLAKRYIVIESNNQTEFEHLITLLKDNDTIAMYFTDDNNRLTRENLQEGIVSLLNFKKPMKAICEEHETALVFPSSLLETELDSVASNLNEPNGKIGQNHESMFTNIAIKEKAPNGKQKNHIITIRGEDYDRLAPGEFLNDTLIDFWISWLVYRMGDVSDQVHVFTTQFYTKLEQEGVESVMSWTAKKNIDIFEKKYVFVPVNKDIHWSLLVIVNPGNIVSDNDEEACNQNLEHAYILFMDSLCAHKKAKLQKTLHKWLNAEAARLRKFDRKDPYENLTCPFEIAVVPTQDNCWDCGVFVCRYAFAMLYLLDTRIECKLSDWRDWKSRKNLIKEYITETEAFDFGMDDIARLREEMAVLIQDLHRIYTQKIEEKKTKKKAKKQSN